MSHRVRLRRPKASFRKYRAVSTNRRVRRRFVRNSRFK